MDIQRWLDETTLPERPPSPANKRNKAPTLSAKKSEQAPKEKRGPKPSTSDSSLLEVPRQYKKTPPIAPQAAFDRSADGSASSDASHPSSGSGSSTSSQHYARKPRRKTRPERYEPASKDVKGRGTRIRRHRKGASSKTKRKHKRSRVDDLGTGIVQGFHAKNVLKDRLTLKPREKLGLFSKGRASSPVKGRGLPDLVFSEMKFLQRHKDQPEPEPTAGLSKRKRKRDQAHAKEETISAYFTSVRPALAERDVNIQAKGVSQKQLQDIEHREKEPPVVDNAIPTVELPDQASYLGFGSGGPRHESGSYISWPESMRAPSATMIRTRIESTINSGQLGSVPAGNDGENIDGGKVLHSPPVPPTVAQHMTESSSGRFQVSSPAPANDRGSRSHSLPQHNSSPRRKNLVDRAAKRRNLESIASPSSMPPFEPGPAKPRNEHRRSADNAAAATSKGTSLSGPILDSVHSADDAPSHEPRQTMSTKAGPQTSSSLGRILEDCNSAFHEQRQAAAAYPTSMAGAAPSGIPFRRSVTAHREPYPTIQRIPTVHFLGVDEIHRARIPEFTAVSIYEQQQQRDFFARQQILDREHGLLEEEPFMIESEDVDEEVDYDAHEWGVQAEGGLDGVDFDPSPEDDLVELLGVDEGQSNTGQRSHVVATSGFWRPHKLY